MIPMHMWLPSEHHTQDSMYIVSSVYKRYTQCRMQDVKHHVPSQQVYGRMCNVVEAAEIGTGQLINESPIVMQNKKNTLVFLK